MRTPVSKEMLKLEAMLTMAGIPHETHIVDIGGPSLQIHAPSVEASRIDAVCHKYSYGGEQGLIEIMSDICEEEVGDGVIGSLQADEAFEYFRRAVQS